MSGIKQAKGPSSGDGISLNNSNNFIPTHLANITGISYLKGNEDEDGSVRQIEDDGKFILQKRMFGVWGNVQVSNQDETILARSVKTGVGSFHLGDLHNLSSAGENVIFRNNHSLVCFFPVWQGITPDGVTIIPAQARVYTPLATIMPNGAIPSGSGSVDATSTALYGSNTSVFGATLVAAEAYTGTLRWVSKFVGSIDIVAFDFDVNVNIGDMLVIPFETPLDARAGANVTSSFSKPDGTLFKVRASTTMLTEIWYSMTLRNFYDSDIFHQGNPAEAARALETLTGTDRLDVLHLKNLEQVDGIAQPWSIAPAYTAGSLVTYTDGNVYKANGAIAAGTAFATGVWGSANTWSLAVLPSSAVPLVDFDGGSAGTGNSFARSDHVHPRERIPIVHTYTSNSTFTPTAGMYYIIVDKNTTKTVFSAAAVGSSMAITVPLLTTVFVTEFF